MEQSIFNFAKDDVDWETIKQETLFMGQNSMRMLVPAIGYLVFSLWLGPKMMEKRKPMSLRNSMRIFNVFSVLMNIYMTYWGLSILNGGKDFFTCNALLRNPIVYARIMDAFIVTRIIDFLDTVFFILRKKTSQVTSLHVFHHFIVPTGVYFGAHYSMTPFMGLPLLLNFSVHKIMYTYYFLATFPKLQPYLWWKSYITKLQIAQFVFDVIYLTLGYILLPKNCGETPNTVLVIPLMLVISIFIYQFSSFYVKNFNSKVASNCERPKSE